MCSRAPQCLLSSTVAMRSDRGSMRVLFGVGVKGSVVVEGGIVV